MDSEKAILCWHMSGKSFSPRHVQEITDFRYEYQHEKGENKELKPGQSVLMEDGVATLQTVLVGNADWEEGINQFLAIMEGKGELLRANGMDSLLFQIDLLYESQCNIELNATALRRLSLLNATLTVSAYKL